MPNLSFSGYLSGIFTGYDAIVRGCFRTIPNAERRILKRKIGSEAVDAMVNVVIEFRTNSNRGPVAVVDLK